MFPLKDYFIGFADLFYPRICLACDQRKPPPGEWICVRCQAELPETSFHTQVENPFTDHFLGRVAIRTGTALFFFNKGSKAQRLIFEFKYRSKKYLGYFFGKMLGRRLSSSSFYSSIDLIIPVPLHKDKYNVRGFNQSLVFAKGIGFQMGLSVEIEALKRLRPTSTQTKMTRLERVENVTGAFVVVQADKIKDKHLLLVDDVLTTGATLEACAIALIDAGAGSVSIATIAIAEN